MLGNIKLNDKSLIKTYLGDKLIYIDEKIKEKNTIYASTLVGFPITFQPFDNPKFIQNQEPNNLFKIHINEELIDMSFMFAGYQEGSDDNDEIENYNSLITYLNLFNVDFSKVTNMMGCFFYLLYIPYFELANADLSKVKYMNFMFAMDANLKYVNMYNDKISNIEDVNGMFYGCESLKTIILMLDTSHCHTTESMFYGCSNLTDIFGISYWDLSNVTHMDRMFYGCESLEELDINGFNVTNVKYMESIFSSCSSLTSLDLSNWHTSNVQYVDNMFEDCTSLTTLYLDNFDVSNANVYPSMFENCNSLNYIRCKQAFKDWCWENQDTIKLPDAMRKGGEGTWEIVENKEIESIEFDIYDSNDDISWDCKIYEYKINIIYSDGSTSYYYRHKEIEDNNNYENYKEIVITETYNNLTISKTITQYRKVDPMIKINLDENWYISTIVKNPNPDVYEGVYETNVIGAHIQVLTKGINDCIIKGMVNLNSFNYHNNYKLSIGNINHSQTIYPTPSNSMTNISCSDYSKLGQEISITTSGYGDGVPTFYVLIPKLNNHHTLIDGLI